VISYWLGVGCSWGGMSEGVGEMWMGVWDVPDVWYSIPLAYVLVPTNIYVIYVMYGNA